MKTFNEFKQKNVERFQKFRIPTFQQLLTEEGDTQDLIEATNFSSASLRKAIEKVHDLELQIQKIEKQMLSLREKFVSLAKDDPGRNPLKNQLIQLNHEKNNLEKQLEKAEIEFQRALSKEEIDDIDINLI